MAQGQSLASPSTGSSTSAVPSSTLVLPDKQGFQPRKLIGPLLFVGPALALIGFFIVYPTFKTIYLSLYTESGIGYNAPLQFVGLDNYNYLTQDDSIRTSIINNLIWLVIVTPLTVVLGVLLATLFDRVKYEAIAKSIVFFPMAISATAAGVIWKLMYADDSNTGTINAIFQHLIPGFQPIAWLGSSNVVNIALFSAQLWASVGFAVVVLSAALKAIPSDLIEAARIDGAGEIQIFRLITVPLIWPTITVIITLTLIGLLKIFDLVYTMTGGGPAGASSVIGLRMYVESFQDFHQGYGAAIAVVLLVAVIPIMAINIRRFQSEGPR